MNGRIFRSRLTDPFLNLSLEHYLFKSRPENERRLLLYVNDPCVVIGRNQNPWRECNLPLVRELGIPLVRRRSGGGTVVHDHGNVNFSVQVPREEFTRDAHARMIVDKLSSLPLKITRAIEAKTDDTASLPMDFPNLESDGLISVNGPQVKLKVNERFDIVTKEGNKKVSGSAYKIERQGAYHHGTMLLNSKLDVLSALLHRNVQTLGTVEGRGVASVKSPVTNIGCDKQVFIESTIDAFKQLYSYTDETFEIDESQLPQQVRDDAASMRTWHWAFANTPDFVHTLVHPELDIKVEFRVSKGVVTEVSSPLYQKAVGMEYKPENLRTVGEWIANAL